MTKAFVRRSSKNASGQLQAAINFHQPAIKQRCDVRLQYESRRDVVLKLLPFISDELPGHSASMEIAQRFAEALEQLSWGAFGDPFRRRKAAYNQFVVQHG